MKHFLFAIGVALMPFVAFGQQVLGIDGENATLVGVYIKDIKSGKVLVESNADYALTPASVTKALTTASVLSSFGTDSCFTTSVYLEGAVSDGVLNGNVVVDAANDPTLESEYLKAYSGFCDSIASHLSKIGVNTINGTVLVRQNMSDAGPIIQWECEDLAWPYGAGLYGFNWRDNTAKVTPATGVSVPEIPGLEICIKQASENDIVRGIDSHRLMVYTANPNDHHWTVTTTVPDPAAVFCAEMRKVLANKGITTSDTATTSDGTRTLLYSHKSATWGEIMTDLMERSDNLYAEGMLRTLKQGATRQQCLDHEMALWQSRGVESRYIFVNDGSGLTRGNRISPRFLGNMLEWMAQSEYSADYLSFFPRAGVDGSTLNFFLPKSDLAGQIALKTGSMSGVQCFAGYKLDAHQQPTHVVVMMVNGFFCPRRDVHRGCERLLERTFLK